LNTLRGKYKSLANDLNVQERQQTEAIIDKVQNDFEQTQNLIEQRKERLNNLIRQRQDFDQATQRLINWIDDKQRFISADPMIPLKSSEIERIQKKLNVHKTPSNLCFYLKSFFFIRIL